MNILLTGMPASGKTTAARVLKELFQCYALVDIDAEIVKLENKSINDIFLKSGEEYFRKIETKVLREVLKKDNQIISSGGGIVKSCENMRIIKEKAVSIYLKLDLETLAARASISSERPLLNNNISPSPLEREGLDGGIKLKLKNMLKERREKYEQADIIIDTKGLTPEQTAKEIMDKINEYNRRKN